MEVAETTMTTWIKCTDKMPEAGVRVLVWGIRPWHPKGFYSVTLLSSYGNWEGCRFPVEHNEILYWTALPDAPDHNEQESK